MVRGIVPLLAVQRPTGRPSQCDPLRPVSHARSRRCQIRSDDRAIGPQQVAEQPPLMASSSATWVCGTGSARSTPVQPKSAARGIRSGPLLFDCHDAEWGVPERDSRALWEKLMLDGFHASRRKPRPAARRLPDDLNTAGSPRRIVVLEAGTTWRRIAGKPFHRSSPARNWAARSEPSSPRLQKSQQLRCRPPQRWRLDGSHCPSRRSSLAAPR